MTIKKALELLDFLIAYESRMYSQMSDPAKSWNVGVAVLLENWQ